MAIMDDPLPRTDRRRYGHSRRGAALVALLLAACLLLVASDAVAQESGEAPAAPSDVRADAIRQPDGRSVVELSWIDNADDEMGFRAIEQRSGRAYEALPSTGPVGDTITLEVPLASGCFRLLAYNNFGASPLSEMACTEGARPSGADFPAVALLLALVLAAFGLWAWRRARGSERG